MSKNSQKVHKIFFTLVILFLFGYAAFNSRFLIKGPEIVIDSLEDSSDNVIYAATKDFSLKGTALHSSLITLNNRPILVDQEGNFDEKLLLSNGISIIDIYARDKFGKEVRKKIDVVYTSDSPSLVLDYNEIALRANIASTTSLVNGSTTEEVDEVVELDTGVSATTTGEVTEVTELDTVVSTTTTSEF